METARRLTAADPAPTQTTPSGSAWVPPSNLEETLRAALIPPRLRIRWLLQRELDRGEAELALLPFLVHRERTALDIGANKGVWSEALRRFAPQVYAFEPNPKMFRELVRGAARNVVPCNLAASDSAGEVDLLVPRTRRGFSNQGATLAATAVAGKETRAVTVKSTRLDELNLGPVGFAKIDVEGHELSVLAGMERTIRTWRPILVIEIEEKHCGRPIAEAIGAVEAFGYQTHALIDGVLTKVTRSTVAALHNRKGDRYVFNWVFLPA